MYVIPIGTADADGARYWFPASLPCCGESCLCLFLSTIVRALVCRLKADLIFGCDFTNACLGASNLETNDSGRRVHFREFPNTYDVIGFDWFTAVAEVIRFL